MKVLKDIINFAEAEMDGVISDLASGQSFGEVLLWQGAMVKSEDMADLSTREMAKMLLDGIDSMDLEEAADAILGGRLAIFALANGNLEYDEEAVTAEWAATQLVIWLTEQLVGEDK